MNKKWVVVLVLPVLCILLGLLSAWALNNNLHRKWQPWGAPPETVVEIMDANASTVLVRTANGEIYRGRGCHECWEKTQELEKALLDSEYECPPLEGRSPSPPGKMIEQLDGTECYADGATFFHYVLLDDNNMWRWSYTQSAFGLLIYPIFGAAGCLLGLLLAVIVGSALAIYSSVKSRSKNRNLQSRDSEKEMT